MAKQKFNIVSLLSAASLQEKQIKEQQYNQIEDFRIEYININDMLPAEENFYNTDDIQDLKAAIELAGVKQNLILKQIGEEKYKVIAGHRRRLACLELVAEGKTQFEIAPCQVIRDNDELKEELILLFTNSTARQLTDYEKTKQAERISQLLTELKKRENIPGRVRELAAEMLKTTPAQIGRYESINKNLNEELTAEYKNNNVNVSVAYEASTLDKKQQQVVLEKLKENGTVSVKEVKKIKESKKEKMRNRGVIAEGKREFKNGKNDNIHIEKIDSNIQKPYKSIDNIYNLMQRLTIDEMAAFICGRCGGRNFCGSWKQCDGSNNEQCKKWLLSEAQMNE